MQLKNEGQGKTLNYRGFVYATLIALFICLIFWPTFRWLVNSWLSSDYYNHGFLVPLVSIAIIWTKRDYLKKRKLSLFSITWLIPGVILYVLGILWEIRVLSALSFICLISGLVILFFGVRAAKALAFPLGILLFMVPFPFIKDIAFNLQGISIFSSTGLLSLLGLPIVNFGSEIYLGDIVFSVGLPCSGVNTLVALLALAAVYTYILKGPFSKRLGLFLLAIPIAIVANIFRIISIILVAYYYNIETAAGRYHDISSPLFFLLSFLTIILTGWILKLTINYGLPRKEG
jgi:exosortase